MDLSNGHGPNWRGILPNLQAAAGRLGPMVAKGLLDFSEASDTLHRAAVQAGVEDLDGVSAQLDLLLTEAAEAAETPRLAGERQDGGHRTANAAGRTGPIDPGDAAPDPQPSVPRRAAELPAIRVSPGEIDLLATAGEDALIASRMPVFRRDRQLVRPVAHRVPASNGRMTVAAGLDEITPPALVDMLNHAAEWIRYDKREKGWRPCDPPTAVAQVILSRAALSRLPSIAAVITTPTLRPDGSVLLEAGYDPATRLYHVADASLVLPPMPRRPTRADAQAALGVLLELLGEFPFVDDLSLAVALSAILTTVVRGGLGVVPMHAFRATAQGTGKSYLADIVSMIATGRPCPVMAVGHTEEETEKRLVGMLLAGFPLISLDNVNGELGGDLLCQAIERPLIRARPLGASAIIEIESRATLIATGNGLRVRGDMTRRTLRGTLDAGMERPELRTFARDPVAEVARDRGRYVAAALIIVRAYLAARDKPQISALASFERWNSWVRGSLLWLGMGDPLASMEAARDDDPELSELREVLGQWSEAVGLNVAMTVRRIDEVSQEKHGNEYGNYGDELKYPDFRLSLLRVAGERGMVSTKRLARWFMDREGRLADGLRIARGPSAQGGIARWTVTSG